MQKKRKRDKADEGPSRAPPIAPGNSHLEKESEESDTELQCKVSRFTFGFLKEHLPGNDSGICCRPIQGQKYHDDTAKKDLQNNR